MHFVYFCCFPHFYIFFHTINDHTLSHHDLAAACSNLQTVQSIASSDAVDEPVVTRALSGALWDQSEPEVWAGLSDGERGVLYRCADALLRRFEISGVLYEVLNRKGAQRGGVCAISVAQMAAVWCRLYERIRDARFLNGALRANDCLAACEWETLGGELSSLARAAAEAEEEALERLEGWLADGQAHPFPTSVGGGR